MHDEFRPLRGTAHIRDIKSVAHMPLKPRIKLAAGTRATAQGTDGPTSGDEPTGHMAANSPRRSEDERRAAQSYIVCHRNLHQLMAALSGKHRAYGIE
jgi:hypothetical protein